MLTKFLLDLVASRQPERAHYLSAPQRLGACEDEYGNYFGGANRDVPLRETHYSRRLNETHYIPPLYEMLKTWPGVSACLLCVVAAATVVQSGPVMRKFVLPLKRNDQQTTCALLPPGGIGSTLTLMGVG